MNVGAISAAKTIQSASQGFSQRLISSTLDNGGRVSANAKYGRFRRFDVRTNETVGDPLRR